MKKLLILLLFFPLSSWALFEARATYGGVVSKDAMADACAGTACAGLTPSMVPLYGLGVDAILKLPLIPIGFGLRYENLGLSASKNGISGDAKMSRTALLVNYRLIDTIIHMGFIGSYGLNHDGHITIANNGSNVVDFTANSVTTYSIGAELEVKPLIVIPLIVGGELGYMGAKWKNAHDNVSGNDKDLDLSGTYIKFFLGIDI